MNVRQSLLQMFYYLDDDSQDAMSGYSNSLNNETSQAAVDRLEMPIFQRQSCFLHRQATSFHSCRRKK